MAQDAIKHEAFSRAVQGQSVMNYASIYEGFLEKGIPESEILPRQNVFTFWAWKAVGRRVKKGEHGVKAVTFVPVSGKKEDTEEGTKKTAGYRMPRTVTVFHVSQTEPEPNTIIMRNGDHSEYCKCAVCSGNSHHPDDCDCGKCNDYTMTNPITAVMA